MDFSSLDQLINETSNDHNNALSQRNKKIFEEKIEELKKEYEKETKISLSNHPNNIELLQDLKNYFQNKNIHSAMSLIKFEPIFTNIDVTKEISDACLFLIDGTSLILECFQNNNIDWSFGGQYLHLVYIFERYIEMFSTLSKYFYIIFFDNLNLMFRNDSRFSLSLSVIINHLKSNAYLKSKTKFFSSVSSYEYKQFLSYEKPTFVLLNKLEKLKELDIREVEVMSKIKETFKIMDIFYLHLEINILLTKNISFNSNRLSGFYCRKRMIFSETVNKYYNHLAKLNYFQETKCLQDSKTDIKINGLYDEFMEEFKKKKKDIKTTLDFYCLALGWCYKRNGDSLKFTEYCTIAASLIVQLFFIQKLDLKQRAIRLVSDPELMNKFNFDLKNFLNNFQSALAHFINCDEFKISTEENCDLFDGRLFAFSLLLCSTKYFAVRFENILSKSEQLKVMLKDGFEFLTSFFFENPKFSFSVLAIERFSIDPKDFFIDVKTEDTVQTLDVNALEDTFFKKLAKSINIKVINKSPTNLSKSVDDFYEYFDWYDYYEEENEFQGKEKGAKNLKLNELSKMSIEKVLDWKSFRNEAHNVTVIMQKGDINEVINYIGKNPDSLSDPKVAYIYLRCLYMKFVNLAESEKVKNISTLALQILINVDKVWMDYLEEMKEEEFFDWVDDSVKLVVEILFYFKLDSLKKDVVSYLNSNSSLVDVNTKERFELTKNFEEYQMTYLSDNLKNDLVTNNDKRTNMFKPDDWQVDFLNSIDNEESMLIIAPTSSGKTYASFYAMQKLLDDKKNQNSVIVYVAPTKALVSQTRFSIMQKFENKNKKNKKNEKNEKNVCGIFTRDCQQDVFNCRILVTVPQCLHILIINSNFCDQNRIKYIIFDEIHNMGGEQGNEVWEHLIMLTKCPYIALSATVGNVEKFHEWLEMLEKQRSSGLRGSVKLIQYNKRFSDLKRFIYTNENLEEIHPISCLNIPNIKKQGKLPNDICLTAQEVIKLVSSIKNIYGESVLATAKIVPNRNLSASLFLTRDCVFKYGKEVLNCFEKLILDEKDETKIQNVIQSLSPNCLSNLSNDANVTDDDLLKLVLKMKNSGMLPCIFFTNHRYLCEKKTKVLRGHLNKMNIRLNDDFKYDSEVNHLLSKNDYFQYESGVAFHHSGISADVKAVVEALFRLGKIKVIFSTATLALGINMPCKTVVFMDDQIYLDSFQYRQASGRAGRRGYDFNGTVVFFDIPKSKVQRLIGSFIPELRPQFPISLSVIMQVYNYASQKKKNEASFNCLIDKSYWQYLYPSKGKQIRYDAVFSLNFLMDLQLIYKDGYVSSFNTLLERIRYHEPSSFLFYYLLVNNVFHEICWYAPVQETQTEKNKELRDKIKKKVMLIMCHLFNRVQILKTTKKNKKEVEEFTLPSLPDDVKSSIDAYNSLVYEQYTGFFTNLSKELLKSSENKINILPISELKFESKQANSYLKPIFQEWTYDAYLTSSFGALSGIKDETLLMKDKLLYFNMTSNINIDNKILPLFHVHDTDLSSYAYRLTLDQNYKKTLRSFIMDQRMLTGDLINYLNDFTKLFDSIKISFNKIALENDPVKSIFNELSRQIHSRFYSIKKEIINY